MGVRRKGGGGGVGLDDVSRKIKLRTKSRLMGNQITISRRPTKPIHEVLNYLSEKSDLGPRVPISDVHSLVTQFPTHSLVFKRLLDNCFVGYFKEERITVYSDISREEKQSFRNFHEKKNSIHGSLHRGASCVCNSAILNNHEEYYCCCC